MRRYGLSDSQCERIKDFLPGREDHVGGTASDSRLFVEAVLYHPIALAFPDAAACPFGDWKSIHRRLRHWCVNGVIGQVFRHLIADHDNEYMMLDSTSARKKRTRTDHDDQRHRRCHGKGCGSFPHSRAERAASGCSGLTDDTS